jgi:hypothetical protein
MSLGNIKKGEKIPLPLNLPAPATGTPIVRIIKQSDGSVILPFTLMSASDTDLLWRYDYTTSGSATSGVYRVEPFVAIDPLLSLTDLATDGTGTGLSSVTGGFTAAMVNEYVIIETNTNNFVRGVYKIASYTDTNNVTLASSAGANATAGTGRIGNIFPGSVDTYTVRGVSLDDTPTVEEIDTELTTEHGSGSWQQSGLGNGIQTVTFHVKDGSNNDVNEVRLSVHNEDNDDLPDLGRSITDENGNSEELNIDDGDISVRLIKPGAIESKVESVTISASGTVDITVTAISLSVPATPNTCRVHFFPSKLGYADVKDASVQVTSKDALSLVNGLYLDHRRVEMTLEELDPLDRYYIDVIYGATIHIDAQVVFGFSHDIVVPSQASYDISAVVGA